MIFTGGGRMAFFDLIMSIVPRNSGELLTHAAAKADAGGGTVAMGRGTASNSFLQMLGFGDAAKDIVYILTDSSRTQTIKNALVDACLEKKRPFGILFSTKVSHFIKTGSVSGDAKEENVMAEKSTHKLITIIVNRGFAEDAMDAARKAGAGGGTIINARGTAKEGDEKFFGMEIIPEKDMVLILSENEKADAILDAVRTLPCLAKPGSGIAFACPAENFTLLGKER